MSKRALEGLVFFLNAENRKLVGKEKDIYLKNYYITMPSKTVHSGLLKTALSEGTWNHVSKIKNYLVDHIGDPDRDGMKDTIYSLVLEVFCGKSHNKLGI